MEQPIITHARALIKFAEKYESIVKLAKDAPDKDMFMCDAMALCGSPFFDLSMTSYSNEFKMRIVEVWQK